MTEHDLSNLEFLLSLDHKGLVEWYDEASDDDKIYALELIQTRRVELAIEQHDNSVVLH